MVNLELGIGLIIVGVVLLIVSRFYDFYNILKIVGAIALVVGAIIIIWYIVTVGISALGILDLMIYDQETLIKNWLIEV